MNARPAWQRMLTMALVAALGYLLWIINRPQPAEHRPEAFTKGYAATGVKGMVSNEKGEYHLRFQARELIQYDQKDDIDMTVPQITMLESDQPIWRFSARTGVFDRQEQRVFFRQQVEARRITNKPEQFLHFTSPDLWFDPNKRSAQTTALVQISAQAVEATARGAEFDLGNNRHRLLSEVHMQYQEPGQRPSP